MDVIYTYGTYTLAQRIEDDTTTYTLTVPGMRRRLQGVGTTPVAAFVRLVAAVMEKSPDVERAKGVLMHHCALPEDIYLRNSEMNRGVRLRGVCVPVEGVE